jgi:hypothetical protein
LNIVARIEPRSFLDHTLGKMTSDKIVATMISGLIIATNNSDLTVAFVLLVEFAIPVCCPADVIAHDVA